jgi:ubiquinol-cytochrome c reductase cytochrome c1 subunit
MNIKIFGVALALVLAPFGAHANEGEYLPFGEAQTNPTDVKTLREGAQLYFNYCSGCHSLKYMRYSRIAQDLQLTEEEVSTNFVFLRDEEAAKKEPSKIVGIKPGDYVHVNMPGGVGEVDHGAEDWFGKVPPDLSLEARSKGVDWIYNYLKAFYVDPTRPLGWNNAVYPGASMPHVLWELQGSQGAKLEPKKKDAQGNAIACHKVEVDGQCFEKFIKASGGMQDAQQYDHSINALTSFLEYVGEPAIIKRESIGVWVLLYLVLFTFIAWLLKSEYWKDVH